MSLDEMFDLNLSLPIQTPVVSFQLEPRVQPSRLKKNPNPPPKLLPDKAPNYSIRCKWYKTAEKVLTCNVHAGKVATLQCSDCIKSGVAIEMSYYCNSKCLYDSWKDHSLHHVAASEGDGKNELVDDQTGAHYDISWPSLGSVSYWTTMGSKRGQWIEISSSKNYRPTIDDLSYILIFECQAIDDNGVPFTPIEIIKTFPVRRAVHRLSRKMSSVGSCDSVETKLCAIETFKLLTYNVLAQYQTSNTTDPSCDWALSWEYRQQILLAEITEYNADILCLQEVQKQHFEEFFKPELVNRGYLCRYKKKITEIFTGKYGNTTHGCAIFFREDKFSETKCNVLEFQTLANYAEQRLKHRTESSFNMIKDNVALVVELKSTTTGASFCVANAHLYYGKRAKDTKLWQVAFLLNFLEDFSGSKPVILCGDLNSTPKSAVYDLLVKGIVDLAHKDLRDTSTEMFDWVSLKHNMNLVSAYSCNSNSDTMNPQTKEPCFTFSNHSLKDTIDYIFYSGSAFTVTQLLDLVGEESLKGYKVLPSPYWPSDHIALMAEFAIKPNVGQ